jgi:hypothetical protein
MEFFLVGVQLGGATTGEQDSEDFTKSRFQVTPQILFGCEGPSNQPNPSLLGQEGRPTQSLLLLPPSPSKN